MARELPRARRLGESTGVILIDLDEFKRLNDTFGHDAGDNVLERVGDLLRSATRNSDIACRFGGEEFAVILPNATLQVARNRAEAIRSALEALKLDFGGRALGSLTLSAGVASLPPHGQSWSDVLQQADRALYVAKQAGRILECHPEVLVKGGDWPVEKIVGAKEVAGWGGQVRSIPFRHERSTTALLAKIRT